MNVRTVTAAAILSCTTALGAPGAAFAQDFTMKISSPSANDVIFDWMSAFKEGVESRADGRLEVQLFPANQLGQIPATVEGVAMGTIEMTLPIIGFLSTLDPRFQVLDASGLFDDEAHMMRTLADPEVAAMLQAFGDNAGVEPLVVLPSGDSVAVSKKAIESAADFEGLKLRTGGGTPLVNRPMEALGASPVALPLGDVLPALQTGTIDGSMINLRLLNAFKYADVATEATYVPGNFTIVGGIVSRDFLARIGPELETIVREEALEAQSVYEDYLASGPAEQEKIWQASGGHIHRMDEARSAKYLAIVEPIVAQVVADDADMQADFDVLNAAAERARQ